MQFQRIPKAILMPNEITQVEIGRILPQHLEPDLRDQLERALLSFDLTTIWTDALLMDSLSTACLFCGDTFLQTELCYHLQEAHHGMSPIVQMYLDQLMPHALAFSDNDCACFACGQVFNLPANPMPEAADSSRLRLVQAHLRTHCPSVLHIALVLTWAHHGNPRLADGLSRRSCTTNAPDLPVPRSIIGQDTSTGTKSRSHQTDSGGPATKRPRQTRPKPRRSPTGRADHLAIDGASDAAPGPRHAGPQPRTHVPVVLQLQRTNRCPEAPAAKGHRMEPTGPDGYITIEDDAVETDPTANAPQRDDDATTTSGRGGGQYRAEASCSEEPPATPRPDDPLHGMEWTPKMPPTVPEDSCELTEDGPTSPGAPGDVQRCGTDTKVPCPSGETEQRGRTLATPTVDERGQTIRVAPSLVSVANMDHSWSEPQAAQPGAEHSSSTPGRPSRPEHPEQGQRQRQNAAPEDADEAQAGDQVSYSRADLQRRVTELTLTNPNNWCFANALTYSLLWCTLAVRCFETTFWGMHQELLLEFLNQTPGCTTSLADAQFFRQVLSSWGHHELFETSSISQQDASECAHVWLRLLQSPLFDMRWEKRMYVAEAAHVMDSSPNANMPICLHFDPAKLAFHFSDFTGLALTWHQVDGMNTSLCTGSPCLCVHVDRCHQGPDGTISKIQNALACDEECFVPVYTQDGTSSMFIGYTIVAVMAHIGSDGCGHYRAGLKLRPTVSGSIHPQQWLLTDEWRAPEATWMLPDWLLQNITMAWMVRSDLVQLPHHQPLMHEHSMTQLLTMLADTTPCADPAHMP